MIISFDRLAGEYVYPVSRSDVARALNAIADQWQGKSRLKSVRFGCSRDTTREARIVQRVGALDIRVNFCLKGWRTKDIGITRRWKRIVLDCGGVIEKEAGTVKWDPNSARRYAILLIYHEVAHVVYGERHGHAGLVDSRGGGAEEKWCDEWAVAAVRRHCW